MPSYPIPIGDLAIPDLLATLSELSPSSILVIADENTVEVCYPKLEPLLPDHDVAVIPPGESWKTLETCTQIWEQMTELSMDRKAIVLNLGGGVIGDMGGFIASTYKRGIRFIQIPTTLLSQVDASVGGKLGIDFQGYKNHIGVFADPQGVFIDPSFLDTLSDRELHSGFAEVIKHHLIADREAWEELQKIGNLREADLGGFIEHSVQIKTKIVEKDPFEQGARKSLNFGHTFGHAMESEWLERDSPFLHGEAIAAGMIMEAWISMKRGLIFPKEYRDIKNFMDRFFPVIPISAQEDKILLRRMQNDKKNEHGEILCTLLDTVGFYMVNVALSPEEVKEAFQHYREEYGLL